MQPSLLRQGAEVGEQLVQGLHRRVRREALGVGSEPDDVREHHGDVREGVGDDALALLEPFGDGPRQHVEHHLASVFRKRGFRSRTELASAFARAAEQR
jgi:hypothetical protein